MSNDKQEKLTASAIAIASLYAKAPKKPATVKQYVGEFLESPEGIAAQVKYLNGDSPEGSPLLDRGMVVNEFRLYAKKRAISIPATYKTIDLARYITRGQRSAGIPVGRNGRMNLHLEHDDGGEDTSGQTNT